MKIPFVVFWAVVPVLTIGVSAAVQQFYPANAYLWSALIAVGCSAVLAGVQAWKQYEDAKTAALAKLPQADVAPGHDHSAAMLKGMGVPSWLRFLLLGW